MGGSGPPLLLLHGIGDSSETRAWAPHEHPLARTRSYMSDLGGIREMFP